MAIFVSSVVDKTSIVGLVDCHQKTVQLIICRSLKITYISLLTVPITITITISSITSRIMYAMCYWVTSVFNFDFC